MTKEVIKKAIPKFLLNWYYQFFPLLGAIIYGFPSKKLTVIGITGTNGKSTVVEMVASILQQAGFKVASISSIRFQIKDKTWQNKLKMTMPGRLKLQRFLRKAVRAGCQYVVIEVTSEGIKQFRHKFIDFRTAVLTNLTKEHIEAHGGFEKYREAKGKLFQAVKGTHIINIDDKNAEYFLQFEADKKYGFGIQHSEFRIKNKELRILKAKDIAFTEKGSSFIIYDSTFNIHLPGQFNVYNALAAICVGLSEGIAMEQIKKGLERVKNIPGRLELVVDSPFSVYVDYAHTPDALENIYKTIHNSLFKIQDSNLICVLGSCGGGRDRWKRPELGRIASQYCHQIILTNEDPYDESPRQIIEEIREGISVNLHNNLRQSAIYEILDRKKAIKKALELARPGDAVIITGKGAEPWMCVAGGKKIPWDDRQIVRQELKHTKSQSYP